MLQTPKLHSKESSLLPSVLLPISHALPATQFSGMQRKFCHPSTILLAADHCIPLLASHACTPQIGMLLDTLDSRSEIRCIVTWHSIILQHVGHYCTAQDYFPKPQSQKLPPSRRAPIHPSPTPLSLLRGGFNSSPRPITSAGCCISKYKQASLP